MAARFPAVPLRRRLLGCLAALVATVPLAGFTDAESLFAPSADLWPRWQAHDPNGTGAPDYAAWNRLLATYLTTDGAGVSRFDYGAVTPEDRAALDRHVAALAAEPVSGLTRPRQFAYWINLYNALTVQVVLAHYPVETIRDIDISPGLFADGPWDAPLVEVEGEALSLNDIEHRILRPIWRDPRIHYAVNCASVGCPNLAPTAYRAETLERDLDRAARAYVNDPRGVSMERGRVTVSKIYNWFHEDFGSSEVRVIEHLKRYAEPDLARRLDRLGRIDGTVYDWSLNDARAAGAD